MSVTAVFSVPLVGKLTFQNNNKNEPPQLSVEQGGRKKKYFKARKQTDCKDCGSDQRHLLPNSRSPLPPSLPTIVQIFLGGDAIFALFFPAFWQCPSLQAKRQSHQQDPNRKREKLFSFPSLNSITNLFFFQSKTPLLYPKQQSLTLEPIRIVSKIKEPLEPAPLEDRLLNTLSRFLLGSQFCQTGSK